MEIKTVTLAGDLDLQKHAGHTSVDFQSIPSRGLILIKETFLVINTGRTI